MNFPILPSTPCVFPLQVIDIIKGMSFERGSCLFRVNEVVDPILCLSSIALGMSCEKLSTTEGNGGESVQDGFWLR